MGIGPCLFYRCDPCSTEDEKCEELILEKLKEKSVFDGRRRRVWISRKRVVKLLE